MSVWTAARAADDDAPSPADPLVVGHRGGRGAGWPQENSIEAFERAWRQGARAVELDARTCAGGDVVVWHDATLPGAPPGGRLVADASVGELRALGVASLADALSWARSAGVAVNVEMKHDVPGRVALARRSVKAALDARADVLLSSFDPSLLAMAAAVAPALPRALLVHGGQPLWADVAQIVARPPLTQWLHLQRTQVGPGGLAPYLRRRLLVGVWTVNEPAEALALARLGAASIITDEPGAVLAALRAQSQLTGSTRTPAGGC